MKVSVVKAAAYAVVGYQTAYLMHYYPVETIAAMLNSMMGSSEKVAHYINFAESLGIQVLPPNINESYSKFTVKGDKIRFGLTAIKNVGINVVDSIVEAGNSKGKHLNHQHRGGSGKSEGGYLSGGGLYFCGKGCGICRG